MKLVFFIIASLFLVNCSDIQFQTTQFVSQHKSMFSDNLGYPKKGFSVFQENIFSSDQLDLVIVLDTNKNTKKLFENNIFGSNFLSYFEDYNWRLAYTDTSADKNLLKASEPKKDKKDKRACSGGGFISSLLGLVGGAYMTSDFIVGMSLKGLVECVKSVTSHSDTYLNNGKFLEFEHKYKRVKLENNYLTKNQINYQEIFNHTMTASHKRGASYDAPVFNEYKSRPLLVTLLSLIRNLEGNKFFRKESQIVYIVITPNDTTAEVNVDKFTQNLKPALQLKRFQFIPVTVPDSDSNFNACRDQIQEKGVAEAVPAVRLHKVSKNLNSNNISICSPNLAEELASQIKQHLYPESILK